MPRGVEFTSNEHEILSKLMKKAWARHKGKEGTELPSYRVRFNPKKKRR